MIGTLALELAVIPSIVLFIIIWRHDKVEKEPAKLLWALFFFGALTTVSAMILGQLGQAVVTSFIDEESMLFILIDNFLLTALIEEGGKFTVLKLKTWKHPAFNYTFDAVVYAVVASLGFATAENILYVGIYGIGNALVRALTAVPSHVTDAIFMGCYYGYAKFAESRGDIRRRKHYMRLALIIPILTHGFYDFCLSTGYDAFIIVFLVYDIAITIHAFRLMKKLSETDTPLYQ